MKKENHLWRISYWKYVSFPYPTPYFLFGFAFHNGFIYTTPQIYGTKRHFAKQWKSLNRCIETAKKLCIFGKDIVAVSICNEKDEIFYNFIATDGNFEEVSLEELFNFVESKGVIWKNGERPKWHKEISSYGRAEKWVRTK